MKSWFAPVLLLVASLTSSRAQTDPAVILMRGSYSVQTSTTAPGVSDYTFAGDLLFSTSTTGITATLIRPAGSATFGTYVDGELYLAVDFSTRAAFELAYPAGTYRVQLGGMRTESYTLNVSAPLPNASFITNFAAAQSIPSSQNFTLTWAPYAGATAQDSILVTVDADDGSFSYASPSFGETGILPGTATQLTLPNLPPNKSFTGSIEFVRFSQGSMNDLSSLLFAYASAITDFSLRTVATGPTISTHPASQHVNPGASVYFYVFATSSGGTLRYQWKKDGVAIPGATGSLYYLSAVALGNMGFYSVTVSDSIGSVDSNIATLTVNAGSSRLTGLSTRGFVPAGGSLTPGFYLRGSGSKALIVRGVGPTLGSFGVAGPLSDPRMDLIPVGSTTPLLTNDDWGTNANLPAMRAAMPFPLAEGSKDAAALTTLSTATNLGYTVRIVPSGAATAGIALAEVYDLDAATSPVRFASLATRGFTGTGENILTPGIIITGDGPKQLLIRAVGPTLASYGVGGVLADPQFRVVPLGRDFAVASNDNWGGTAALQAAFLQTYAFPLPTDSRDAAVIVRLPPGGYTIQATGVGDTTGNVLVEVYDMDPAPAASGSSASAVTQAAQQMQTPIQTGSPASATSPSPTSSPVRSTPPVDPTIPAILPAGG